MERPRSWRALPVLSRRRAPRCALAQCGPASTVTPAPVCATAASATNTTTTTTTTSARDRPGDRPGTAQARPRDPPGTAPVASAVVAPAAGGYQIIDPQAVAQSVGATMRGSETNLAGDPATGATAPKTTPKTTPNSRSAPRKLPAQRAARVACAASGPARAPFAAHTADAKHACRR